MTREDLGKIKKILANKHDFLKAVGTSQKTILSARSSAKINSKTTFIYPNITISML